MQRPRGFVFLALGLLFGVAVCVYPKESFDVKAIVRDLRVTVKDLDARLRLLESKAAGTPARVPDLAAAQTAYMTGRALESRRDYQNAVDAYTKAVELDPGNDSAFLHRAYALFELGGLDQALADVNQSLKVQPDNSRAYAFRGKVYREEKDYERALPDLQEALMRDPENPDFLVAIAAIQEDQGHFDKALDAYDKALRIKYNAPAVHVKRAVTFERMNQLDDAFTECSVAVQLDRTNAEAYACRAGIYVHKGQFPSAIVDLNEAIRIEPNLPEATKLVSTLRELVDLNETAKKLSEQQKPTSVVEPPPAPAPSSSQPAQSAPSVTQQTAPALSASQTAALVAAALPPVLSAQAPPPSPGAAQVREAEGLTNTARDFTQKGQFEDALGLLNEAVAIDPSSAVAYNSRGYVYLRMRQCEPAARDFSAAIQLRPGYLNAYWNRSVAERMCGDQSASQEDMKKAVGGNRTSVASSLH